MNRRLSKSYPNGIVTEYTYDDLDRLTNLSITLGPTPISDIDYTYDDAGNLTSKTTAAPR